jgi:hypothetical protein
VICFPVQRHKIKVDQYKVKREFFTPGFSYPSPPLLVST